MKIYNRCVIDIKTGTILEEDAFEHDGPIAKCFGGNDPAPTQTSYIQSPEQRQMFQLIMPLMAMLSRSGMGNRLQNPVPYNPQNRFYPQQGMQQGGQQSPQQGQQGGQGINPFQWWAQSQMLKGGKK